MKAGRIVPLAALLPSLGLAQVSIGVAPVPGAAVLGRACVDVDRDGRCGMGDPGIAGARVLTASGGVAMADAGGRFHLLEAPARVLARDRTAYGGEVVALEGFDVRRALELAPHGAAAVDLAVAPPPPADPPRLSGAAGDGKPPSRVAAGLRWTLGARSAPGAHVAVDGRATRAAPDGAVAVDVLLAPGENRFGVGVFADGAAAIYGWSVHLVPRPRGGDLVVPGEPERLASFAVLHAAGGGALLVGEARPGLRVRAGGVVALPARQPPHPGPLPQGGRGDDFLLVAAFLPAGGDLALLDERGEVIARAILPLGEGRVRGPLHAVAALAQAEVAFGGTPGVLFTGRGAGATRGRVGRVSWEAGVDLDDRDERLADLARPRDVRAVEHALEPARTFVTVGDDGAADDRNPGRGRLWARVDADGARLDVGAARAGLTGTELGRYDRALFGAKAAAQGAAGPLRIEASAFGATLRADGAGNAPPRAAHDVIRATGGAALWLSNGAVVPGSEAIRIERRDPFSGRLVGQRALVRGVDYEIDWTAGRIVLAAPLASVSPPAIVVTGDPFAAAPAFVTADYLHAAAGPGAEDLHGGRVGAALGPVALGAHAAREERGGDAGYRLLGARAELDLGPALRVRGEVARTRGLLFARGPAQGFARSDDGLVFAPPSAAAGDARAIHLEAEGGAGPLRLEGWWREREAGYSDAEFLEAISARERGAAVAVDGERLGATLRWAERRSADPRDPAGLARLDAGHLVGRATWRAGRLGLAAEGVHAVREGDLPRAEETSAGVRASWAVDDGLAVDAAHHQKLHLAGAGLDPTFTSAGATLVRGPASLSVRGGWGPDLGPRVLVSGARLAPGEAVYGTFGADPDAPDVLGGAAATLGVRQRTGRAELFTEEQFERDLFGLRQARVLGATLAPLAGVTLTVSGERGQRLRPDGSLATRSAAAAAAAVVRGPVRLAARAELRDEGGDRHEAAGGAAEWRVGPGASLAARASFVRGTSAGVEGLGVEASLGGALRRDRLGVAASGARIVERRPAEARRDGWVTRLAVTADVAARVELGVAGALAIQEVAGARDDRVAGSARARVGIAGPLDAAVEYARRAPLRGGRLGELDSVRAEAGLAARESRIAVGYNFVGFGGDGLSPASDTGRVYVRAQLTY